MEPQVRTMQFKQAEQIEAVTADRLAQYVVEVHGRLWQFRLDKVGIIKLKAMRREGNWRYPDYSMLVSRLTEGRLREVSQIKQGGESSLGCVDGYSVFVPDEWERVNYWFELYQLVHPETFIGDRSKNGSHP